MSKPEDKGRCMNCGFLAKHPSGRNAGLTSPPSYYEIEYYEREHGEAWVFYRASGPIETSAMCFRSAANIPEEVAALWQTPTGQDTGKSLSAKDVFERDRNCEFWYRYQPGLSPKEHYDQFIMEQLEQSRREFEERLERDRKEFDLKLFEISQKIQNDSHEISANSYKIASRAFWFGLISTLVIIALTILQVWIALRPRSSDSF